MKKTFKQAMLNRSIDRCLLILGSSKATDKQKKVALKILNACYKRSGVPYRIDAFGEIELKGAVHGNR